MDAGSGWPSSVEVDLFSPYGMRIRGRLMRAYSRRLRAALFVGRSGCHIDAKYAAAAVLGWVPREEVTLADRDFVSVLWEKASERHNPEVKEAARLAFSDETDAAAASAHFIEVDLDERDLAEARANEVKVRDIMYAAEADGFKPTVVTAAKKALEGPALDRSLSCSVTTTPLARPTSSGLRPTA